MKYSVQLRIADYLICKANDKGIGVELIKDIMSNTDCTESELLSTLKTLNSDRNWQASVIDFKNIVYYINYASSADLLFKIINNRQTMDSSYGESGRIDDNMMWARIVTKESIESVMSAINSGINSKVFDFEDEYFFYNSESEICYSWTTFEDFRKLDLLWWN